MDDLFYETLWNENFRSIERFHAEKKPAISDSTDFVCSLARGEHCPMELVSGTGNIIRLGNFQYSILVIKDEYGFSPVIGIKVILNFILSSNGFNNWKQSRRAVSLFFFHFLNQLLLYFLFKNTQEHLFKMHLQKLRKKPSIHLLSIIKNW